MMSMLNQLLVVMMRLCDHMSTKFTHVKFHSHIFVLQGQLVAAVSSAYALSSVDVISKEAIVSWILYALLSGIGYRICHFVA
jgi:hypothetical protein